MRNAAAPACRRRLNARCGGQGDEAGRRIESVVLSFERAGGQAERVDRWEQAFATYSFWPSRGCLTEGDWPFLPKLAWKSGSLRIGSKSDSSSIRLWYTEFMDTASAR